MQLVQTVRVGGEVRRRIQSDPQGGFGTAQRCFGRLHCQLVIVGVASHGLLTRLQARRRDPDQSEDQEQDERDEQHGAVLVPVAAPHASGSHGFHPPFQLTALRKVMVTSNTFRARVSRGAVTVVPSRLNVGAAAGGCAPPAALADSTATLTLTTESKSAT